MITSRLTLTKHTPLAARGHEVVPKDESYTSLHFARPSAVRITSRGLEAGLDSLGAAAAAGI